MAKIQKMNKLERIWCIFILDESGSMFIRKQDTITAFNTILQEQRKYNDIDATLIKFSDYVKIPEMTSLNNLNDLSNSNYSPAGNTALYKAIYDGITSIENELRLTKTNIYPKDVLFFIFSDGEENASGPEYPKSKIQEKIKEMETKYDWKFQFNGMELGYQEGINLGIKNTINTQSMEDYRGAVSYSITKSRGN